MFLSPFTLNEKKKKNVEFTSRLGRNASKDAVVEKTILVCKVIYFIKPVKMKMLTTLLFASLQVL